MPHNTLKKITSEAKRIRKRHPNTSWKSAVKQAGKKYRTGKIRGTKKRRKRVGAKRRSRPLYSSSLRIGRTRKRKRVGSAMKSHQDALDKKRVDITIGSVHSHLSAAKRGIEHKIAHLEVSKFKAKKVSQKKKFAKRIREQKSLFNKLS